MKITIDQQSVKVEIERSLYNEDTIFKCFYWYSRDFIVNIETKSEHYIVSLQSKGSILQPEFIREKVSRDLVDFKLRDIVTKETRIIRELIVAKAFAWYDEEITPAGTITDPIGFNPEKC